MRIRWIYFLPCFILTPVLAKAQDIGALIAASVGGQGSLRDSIAVPKEAATSMSPAVSTVDPQKKTTTLQLSSGSKDTIEVMLALVPDSAAHSLKAWITDLPKKVIILPRGRQYVTVTVNVPKDAAAGEYSATVKASSQKLNGKALELPTAPGVSPPPDPSSKLVYTVK